MLQMQVLTGMLVLGQRYSLQQWLAVLCVTAGIVVVTFKPARSGEPESADGRTAAAASAALAVAALLASLVAKALGGALKERVCRRYGLHMQEMLFWQSALGVPLFAFKWAGEGGIRDHLGRWASPELGAIALGPLAVPTLWALLVANVSLDYGCKCAVTRLIGYSSSLTAAMMLTVSKLISIAISATIVNAPPYPGASLWVGCAAVAAGNFLYQLAPKPTTITAMVAGGGGAAAGGQGRTKGD